MNRREFLKLSAVLLLSGLANACSVAEQEPTPSEQKQIVVIGAGLAGLAAARQLQQMGHDVVVVEARERVGGRIWTSTKWEDIPVDFGATWIHGVRRNPITELADEIQASRLSTSYDRYVLYASGGQLASSAEEASIEALRERLYDQIATAQAADDDASILQVIHDLRSQYDESSAEYRFINFILSAEFEMEYAGGIDDLSAHWFDSIEEFAGEDVLFAHGFQVITQFLASDLRLELGQVVREIQWQQAPVRVITEAAEFEADQVVVTLPLGVLQAQQVQFSPELPGAKQTAVSRLGMGVLNKCYLRFQQAFWPETVDWLEYVSPERGVWSEWVSFMWAANVPVLLGFSAAERAREIEAWSDAAIVASAMATLRVIFGPQIPDPVDYQITRWAMDPFALGSYSFNALGATPEMRTTLAAPLGDKLFFAGEATERDYFGTAHGAYLSGLRAADEILAV